jgi:hypothetical protein
MQPTAAAPSRMLELPRVRRAVNATPLARGLSAERRTSLVALQEAARVVPVQDLLPEEPVTTAVPEAAAAAAGGATALGDRRASDRYSGGRQSGRFSGRRSGRVSREKRCAPPVDRPHGVCLCAQVVDRHRSGRVSTKGIFSVRSALSAPALLDHRARFPSGMTTNLRRRPKRTSSAT